MKVKVAIAFKRPTVTCGLREVFPGTEAFPSCSGPCLSRLTAAGESAYRGWRAWLPLLVANSQLQCEENSNIHRIGL